jgi:hypothetical protein
MKEELRSKSQAEIWTGRKIRKSPFLCPIHLLAISDWTVNVGLNCSTEFKVIQSVSK